jgi:hypothetical protein
MTECDRTLTTPRRCARLFLRRAWSRKTKGSTGQKPEPQCSSQVPVWIATPVRPILSAPQQGITIFSAGGAMIGARCAAPYTTTETTTEQRLRLRLGCVA